MPVQPARRDDAPEIAALIHELAAYERLEHEVSVDTAAIEEHLFGEAPAAHAFVAVTDGGEVAGFALWFRTFSTFLGRPGVWLEDLFVRPEHRGKGYGMALLQEVRALANDGRVELMALDWNKPAIELYRSLGAESLDGWTRYRWSPTGA